MSHFERLIKEMIKEELKEEIDDYSLNKVALQIQWALNIKNYYFPKLVNKNIENKEDLIYHLENLPDFYSSWEAEKFEEFLFKCFQAIKKDKEKEANRKKLEKLKRLEEEIEELRKEIYGNYKEEDKRKNQIKKGG